MAIGLCLILRNKTIIPEGLSRATRLTLLLKLHVDPGFSPCRLPSRRYWTYFLRLVWKLGESLRKMFREKAYISIPQSGIILTVANNMIWPTYYDMSVELWKKQL